MNRFTKRLLLSAAMTMYLPMVAFATDDDLQEYINGLGLNSARKVAATADSEPIDIDLSAFSAVTRDKPLEISNGLNCRLINGNLTSAEGYVGTLLKISGGSTVTLGEGANILQDPNFKPGTMHDPLILVYSDGSSNNTLNIEWDVTVGQAVKDFEFFGENDYCNMYRLIETDAAYTGQSFNTVNVYGGVIYGTLCGAKACTINTRGGIILNLQYGYDDYTNCSGSVDLSESWILNFTDQYEEHHKYNFDINGPVGNPVQLNIRTVCYEYGNDIFAYSKLYTFTAEDAAKFTVHPIDSEEPYEVVADSSDPACSYLRIRKVQPQLTGAAWLQNEIDKAATAGESQVWIELPDDNFVLERGITVPTGLTAIVIGTNVEMTEIFEDDYVFHIYGDFVPVFNFTGSPTFVGRNFIELDGGSLNFTEGRSKWTYLVEEGANNAFVNANKGHVTLNAITLEGNIPFFRNYKGYSNIEMYSGYVLTHGKFIESTQDGSGWVTFNMHEGNLENTSYEENGGQVLDRGTTFYMNGGFMYIGEAGISPSYKSQLINGQICGGSIQLSGYTTLGSGMLFEVTDLLFLPGEKEYCEMAGDMRDGPQLYFAKEGYESGTNTIHLTSAVKEDTYFGWNFYGIHSKFLELNIPIIIGGNGYTMTLDDFKNINFHMIDEETEAAYEVYFDEATASARLRKKKVQAFDTGDDLQDFLNSLLGNATGSEAVEVQPGEDGLDITSDLTIGKESHDGDEDDLQLFINGLKGTNEDGSKDLGSMKLSGGDIKVLPGACVTFNDIYIDGCTGSHSIYVEGTLIIDIDVYIHLFESNAIVVRPGGKVIINGGDFSDVTTAIFNSEGGTVSVTGGNLKSSSSSTSAVVINSEGGTFNWEGASAEGGVVNRGSFTVTDGEFKGSDGFSAFTNEGGNVVVVDALFYPTETQPAFTNRGGTVRIEGGVFISDENNAQPGIDTDSDIVMCGCVVIDRIHLRGDAAVRIFSKLETLIRVHLYYVGHNMTVLAGEGEYLLTPEDFAMIEWVLPAGYHVEYDAERHIAVMISENVSVDDISAEDAISAEEPVYDLQGKHVGAWSDRESLAPGIYIVAGSKVRI